VGVEGARHLLVGEPYVHRALTEIVQRTNPAALPLPTEWP
ncbi:MAG: alpha/beta hydrolase, partial [Actinophytocola sp.]|nr:alpha/beta hydrolase [Actinophytocola sp.]